MRPFLFLIICCWCVLRLAAQQTAVHILSHSATEIWVEVSFAQPIFTAQPMPYGDTLYQVQVSGTTPLLKKGFPSLPQFTFDLATLSATPARVEVVSAVSQTTQHLHTPIVPSKGAISRAIQPSSLPLTFSNIYQKNISYPAAQPAVGLAPHAMAGVWGQTIAVYPVLYEARAEKLTTFSQLVLKITLPAPLTPVALAQPLRASIGSHYLNADKLLSPAEYSPVLDAAGNMLILSPAPYMAALQPFVAWKNQKGIRTELVDIATVGNSVSAIQTYINAYYAAHGLTYLLIVGDYEDIPSPILDNGGGDLGGCDNCYAHQVGNDAYLDFLVGRFSATSLAEVQTQVARTLAYEQSPYIADTAWYRKAVGIASNEGGNGSGNNGQADYQHQNTIKANLLQYGYKPVFELYDGNHTAASPTSQDSTADKASNPTAAQVVARINQGISLMNYTGHGDVGLLVTSNFTNSTVGTLTNTQQHPFTIVVGCNAGKFDNGQTCLGEALLRAHNGQQPTGSIAGYLSSILQDWDSPMEGQQEMNRLIAEKGAFSSFHTIGGIGVNGMAAMIDKYGGVGDTMAKTWTLFGDPSVQLRTRKPFALTATHDTTISLGATQFSVQCSTAGALVALTQNGQILATAYATAGSAALSFMPVIDTATLLVTITAYNALPYTKAVQVHVPQGAYAVCNTHAISDMQGNQNGMADTGEPIAVAIGVQNFGQGDAQGLTATLFTTDALVSIADSTESLGNILAGANSQYAAAFQFVVKDSIPDMHEVLFWVKISDGQGNVWKSPMKVMLFAPVLTVADWQWDDSVGGNGNGIAEDGEQLTLRLHTLNIGHSAATATGRILHNAVGYLSPQADSLSGQNLLPQQTNTQVFTLNVAASAPVQQAVLLQYTLKAGKYTQAISIPLTLNPQHEPFDGMAYAFPTWDSTNTDFPWFLTNQDIPNSGDGCLRSGAISDYEQSTITIAVDVAQADYLQFARRVSSEQGYDFLTVSVDGATKGAWSGEENWAKAQVWLSQGTHTLAWTYTKDEINGEGSDCAWIDDVIFPSLTQVLAIGNNPQLLETMRIAPNPSAASATLLYTLPAATAVAICVHDVSGKCVAKVSIPHQMAGEYTLPLSLDNLPAGLYFVRMETEQGFAALRWVKE